MSVALSHQEGPADPELISAVRGGDVDAYGALFARHVDAARRLARQLVSSGDVDDLVSEAFAKVLTVLQRGGGPDVAFRAYLLTAVRRLHVDKMRASARVHTTDDITPFDPGVPFRDTAVEGFDNAAAAKAFASLPERWQLVLWHTEVEGHKPADVAPILGMSPNSVSALAYRAREGLRQAFLTMHAQELDEDTCRWTHQQLGAYVRNSVSRRDAAKVEAHLDECRTCMAIYLELTEVNSNLGGIIAPLLLGTAASGYMAAASLAAKGGVLLFLDRAKESLAGTGGQVAAVATVASVALAGGIAIASMGGPDERQVSTADQRPGVVAPAAPGEDNPGNPGDPGKGTKKPAGNNASIVPPVVFMPPLPTTPPTDGPTTPPTTIPTSGPTEDPTSIPTETSPPTQTTEPPTSEPTTEPTTSEPTTEPTTSEPTTEPTTSEPTTEPTTSEPTTSEPTTEPTTTPPATYDLAVGVNWVRDIGHNKWHVSIGVSGVDPDAQATIDASLSGTGALMLPATCHGVPCTATDTRDFLYTVTDMTDAATVTFTVSSGAGDLDPTNNTVTVTMPN